MQEVRGLADHVPDPVVAILNTVCHRRSHEWVANTSQTIEIVVIEVLRVKPFRAVGRSVQIPLIVDSPNVGDGIERIGEVNEPRGAISGLEIRQTKTRIEGVAGARLVPIADRGELPGRLVTDRGDDIPQN